MRVTFSTGATGASEVVSPGARDIARDVAFDEP